MTPNFSGQHKNPWFYIPRCETDDGELDFFSLGRNLQGIVRDKLYEYSEQANFEETSKQIWSLFDGFGYRFRATTVAMFEDEEQIVTPTQKYSDLSFFTQRGVQIVSDTLGLSYSDQSMDESRRIQCVERIEDNGLQATRLIIDIPELELDLFSRLITSTRPKVLVFSRPMPVDFLSNEFICEKVENLYLPEGMRVEEEEILRFGAKELTVRCGMLTSNGLVQIAQDFLSSKRSPRFLRIHLSVPSSLPDDDFHSVAQLFPSVQLSDSDFFLLTRPEDSKMLKFSLLKNCLTISEPWMIF